MNENGSKALWIFGLCAVAFLFAMVLYINMRGVDATQSAEIARNRDEAQNFRELALIYRAENDQKMTHVLRRLNEIEHKMTVLESSRRP